MLAHNMAPICVFENRCELSLAVRMWHIVCVCVCLITNRGNLAQKMAPRLSVSFLLYPFFYRVGSAVRRESSMKTPKSVELQYVHSIRTHFVF